MRKEFRNISIEKDIISYGERCNIITFSEELFNKYQLSALSKQHEKLGFLQCACKYKDDNVDIYYYTTGLISISQYFSKANITKTEFASIIKAICQSIKLCSNYAYFNKNNLILDEELIYINSKDKSIYIMYVPTATLITDDVIYDLKKVIINLINNNLMVSSNEGSFTQEILEELRNERLNVDQIIKSLDNIINRNSRGKIVQQTIGSEEFKPESFTNEIREKPNRNVKGNKGIKEFLKNLFSPEDNNQSDDKGNLKSTAYLVDDNWGEKITIDKDIFVIGRLNSIVDYEIKNKTIGKTHAKFVNKENKFYLVDLESKNGTYINGTKLIPNSLYEVEDGASIIFSNLKYTFKIEKHTGGERA